MIRPQRNTTRSFLVQVLFLSLGCTAAGAQQLPRSDREAEQEFLDVKVSEFQIHNATFADGLWKIAQAPEPFAFGFEKVLKRKLSDPDTPDPLLNLQLKDNTVRQILDALCRADSRYTWSLDGTTVNVFPRDTISDSTYLLNRELARFELRNAKDVDEGLLAIFRQLPPPTEQIAEAQAGGGDPYPLQPWTISFENLTVRQVVNRLARHGGPCGTWIFGGAQDFRAFAFFNTYLRCPGSPHTKPSGTVSSPSKS